MNNKEIREYAKTRNIALWRIANELDMLESNFLKLLNKELSEVQKEKIKEIIDKLALELDKRKSFVLYSDCTNFVSVLSNEQKGKLFQQILDYVNDGTDIETDDKSILIAWLQIKNALDRDLEKYEKVIKTRVQKGRLGGIIRALKSNQLISDENIEFLIENKCYTKHYLKKQDVSDEMLTRLNAIRSLVEKY
jgi:hypothetical protein